MAYTLTKHGALGFAEWLTLNYRHLGIRVVCICPNAVNTGMLGRNEDDEARPAAQTTPPYRRSGRGRRAGIVCRHGPRRHGGGPVPGAPPPRVGESFARKAGDYDRWLDGTNRRLRRMRGENLPA